MRVEVQFHLSAQPSIYEDAENTYEKGSFYCVRVGTKTHKIPIKDIFRSIEDYGYTQSTTDWANFDEKMEAYKDDTTIHPRQSSLF